MGQTKQRKVFVLGAGNFGTSLSQHLARLGHEVCVWSIEKDVVDGINNKHKNPKYLREIDLVSSITATTELDSELIRSSDLILNAIPVQYMRDVWRKLKPLIHDDHLITCASKGIEVGSLSLPGDIFENTIGKDLANKVVFISGPSFAVEVAERLPTAVSAASFNQGCAKSIQAIFHDSFFRVYTSEDPVGVEVAGALKNVVAIAAGAAKGLGFEANTSAALLTRGLAEISRFGVKLGANPLTFNGLSGVGDLFLTCTSEKSRNFTVGYRLGKGEDIKEIISTLGSVAEGVSTAQAAYELSQKLKIDSPITAEVHQVLYHRKSINDAVTDLISREPKSEINSMN
ncbi:NAD(P)-dependent glycerol-3-phosphate dehydrogenase [Oligoflexaceae bacterium]|nr:NAD(P)-dependent glycerol-3-phosphate dehydrogenase [Oligoflexaceae bacterium]